jgi:hypothetical protein
MAVRIKKAKTESKKKSPKKVTLVKKNQQAFDMQAFSEVSETTEKKRSKLPFIVLFILLLALLYYFRGLFVAASVNGQLITRIKVIKNLEAQSGQQALDDIITKSIVEQEAKKKNIKVTDEDVKAEIVKIEASFAGQENGSSLDDLLSAQGMTRADLEERIRFQKIAEKLLEGTIEVTDDEVKTYIAQNKSYFPAGTSEDDMKVSAKEQVRQEKLNTQFQDLLGKLRNDAKIRYFVNYK